ncbi:GNAT family N-acetyltransferase [Phycicoccus endophyticus]|uniref:GNAT family N-acetyltransferase n=1 Tax=Phycicoccus endophyticus TaxID=1690220 RepID=A0A7G9R481_9MICO|nr:GNAT family N-acetyltransferase [Phycicoccus endophyticus]NHI18259.1 GNAT family N-acetyltransferase [Phycicoccus endophyticus]QNN50406.1 GNAT family N-acetyltransferase [Phycicoccus endophyticus]GGL25168.1 N-acetyltransferase [Phycicoccus endophyticus]
MPDGLSAVRVATAADLPAFAPIEDAGDEQFARLFGGVDWPAATPGEDRAREPGFLLTATEAGRVVGFAHVVQLGGHWHLEQLAVDPPWQRRGHGGRLLAATHAEVATRGGAEVTLVTYADVPWNGPWYARHGYAEVDPPARLAPVLAAEDLLGLAQHGRRVAMRRDVGAAGVSPRAGSRA